MRWMLEAAGIPTRGIRGELRVKGLVAVWLWTLRAWRADDSEDLSATMAALDAALRRAEQAAEWLGWRAPEAEAPPDTGEPDARGRRAVAARDASLSVVALPPIKGARQGVR